MKTFGRFVLGFVCMPFFFALIYAHVIGMLFAASIVVAALAGWMYGVSIAFGYLSVAWKVYAGFGVFTFLFLVTFSYQHCCVGMESFTQHLKHHGWSGVADDFVGAVIWPWAWYMLDKNLKGWHSSLVNALCLAVEYWVIERRRGTPFTTMEVNTGKVTTSYVQTPEEALGIIRDSIANRPQGKAKE